MMGRDWRRCERSGGAELLAYTITIALAIVIVATLPMVTPQRVRERGYRQGEYGLSLSERAGKTLGGAAVDFGSGVISGVKDRLFERQKKDDKE